MIKEYGFYFNDLAIDTRKVFDVLGFEGGFLPAPFDDYFQQAWDLAGELTDIRASFCIVEDVSVDVGNNRIVANEHGFNVGRIVSQALRGSEKFAFIVSTAGKYFSDTVARLLKEEPVEGYVYDVLGNFIAESAGDKVQSLVIDELKGNNLNITNRYSPGYCNWDVADQHKLFSFFPGHSPAGVQLTSAALMQPVKSISGIVGLGVDVKYSEYMCDYCNSKDCVYKKLHRKYQ